MATLRTENARLGGPNATVKIRMCETESARSVGRWQPCPERTSNPLALDWDSCEKFSSWNRANRIGCGRLLTQRNLLAIGRLRADRSELQHQIVKSPAALQSK